MWRRISGKTWDRFSGNCPFHLGAAKLTRCRYVFYYDGPSTNETECVPPPRTHPVTEGSARNAKNHIAIGMRVKQILIRRSKHSQSLLNIATPSKSDKPLQDAVPAARRRSQMRPVI